MPRSFLVNCSRLLHARTVVVGVIDSWEIRGEVLAEVQVRGV